MTDATDPHVPAPLPGALLANPQPETPLAGPAGAPSGVSSNTSSNTSSGLPSNTSSPAPSGALADSQRDAAVSALRSKLVRNLDEVALQREHRPPLYDSVCGRLSTGTAARKLGAGYDILAPGQRVCPYHFHHAQEEMFVILEGCGSLRVAGELLPLRAGDVVFIPPGPEYPHQIINTSDAPMRYLSISTQERPEVCEYPDSGKLSVSGGGVFRAEDAVDYWHGEP